MGKTNQMKIGQKKIERGKNLPPMILGFLLCKNYAVQDLDESLRKHTTGGLRDMKECDTHR